MFSDFFSPFFQTIQCHSKWLCCLLLPPAHCNPVSINGQSCHAYQQLCSYRALCPLLDWPLPCNTLVNFPFTYYGCLVTSLPKSKVITNCQYMYHQHPLHQYHMFRQATCGISSKSSIWDKSCCPKKGGAPLALGNHTQQAGSTECSGTDSHCIRTCPVSPWGSSSAPYTLSMVLYLCQKVLLIESSNHQSQSSPLASLSNTVPHSGDKTCPAVVFSVHLHHHCIPIPPFPWLSYDLFSFSKLFLFATTLPLPPHLVSSQGRGLKLMRTSWVSHHYHWAHTVEVKTVPLAMSLVSRMTGGPSLHSAITTTPQTIDSLCFPQCNWVSIQKPGAHCKL